MYDPRPVRLQWTDLLRVPPSGSVSSPEEPGRMTKIRRSGARPLATTNRPSEATGVGAVSFELCPSFHNSLPVRGSYPRTKFDALVRSSGPAAVIATVGVPHDGSSWRSVFHTVSPVSTFSAITNESACVSHCRMTRPFQMIGELAGPHSNVGMSYAPRSMRPRSTFHRKLPLTS